LRRGEGFFLIVTMRENLEKIRRRRENVEKSRRKGEKIRRK